MTAGGRPHTTRTLAERIFRLLAIEPMTIPELCARTGRSRRWVVLCLEILRGAGCVTRTGRAPRPHRYSRVPGTTAPRPKVGGRKKHPRRLSRGARYARARHALGLCQSCPASPGTPTDINPRTGDHYRECPECRSVRSVSQAAKRRAMRRVTEQADVLVTLALESAGVCPCGRRTGHRGLCFFNHNPEQR